MKIRTRKTRADIDLEVVYDAERTRWVVRQFGGDPLKVFAVGYTKSITVQTAIALAKVFANYVNRDGSCEVYFRELDGTFERNTYGRDPEKSKG